MAKISQFFILSFSLLICFSNSQTLIFRLTNTVSAANFPSAHHLLKSASTRSVSRHRHRNHVSLPLAPGSDYTLSFALGNSSQAVSLYMDTGSDLVWLPCRPFTCMLCDGKYDPKRIPDSEPVSVAYAARVACGARECLAAHGGVSSSDLCAVAGCPLDAIETSDCSGFGCPEFYYAYGDGSLIARLYTDRLTIPMSTPSIGIQNFTFGCAHSALGEPIGVAGFGRGVLSLPAQLASSSPGLGKQFSYCLVSHTFDADKVTHPSPLILGRRSADRKQKRVHQTYDGFVYTPILDNPKYPYFYSVGLEAVSIGKKKIPAPGILKTVDKAGNGGMVVDSGTTFTILPSKLYNSVVSEFSHQVGPDHKRAGRVEESTGLSPCYYYDNVARVPAVVLHFAGNNSSVVLPSRNYFYEFLDGGVDGKGNRKVGCVMLMNGGDDADGGPVATLGNYQQQGFEVVYDLEQGRVGFARRKCASLWDSLKHESRYNNLRLFDGERLASYKFCYDRRGWCWISVSGFIVHITKLFGELVLE